MALLSKWLWRYQSEVGSLWRSLIEAKYKAASPNQFPCVSRHHNSKSPWHNIVKLQRYITGYTEWQIADGRNTLFWFSNWNNKGCLNISIPRFFALSSNPNLSVFEAWDPENQCWNLHPRRPLIQREKDLWNATTVGWPQPTREPRDDKIKWKLTNDGTFTVKSMKDHIRLSPQNYPRKFVGNLWSLLIPKKCKFFL